MARPLPLFPPPLGNRSDVGPFYAWLDDLACETAPVHDLLSETLSSFALDGRERSILTARFGLDGQDRVTLQAIGEQHAISRERVRQLVDRSVTRVLGRALKSVDNDVKTARDLLTQEYGPGGDVEALIRRLTLEACATETGPLTKSLAVMKLRLAGHRASGTQQIAKEVHSRVARVRKRLRELESIERKASVADSYASAHLQRWLSHVEWPADTTGPCRPIPDHATRHVDIDEEGHGATFFDKLGREAAWDSRFEARLLRILNDSSLVAIFQEQPVRVGYQWKGQPKAYFPDVVAQLRDGRTVLIEAKPLYEVAYAMNQDKFDAARAYAHSQGWGWLVWTDRCSIPDLVSRNVDPVLAQRVTETVMSGDLDWRALRRFDAEGLELLDLIALTIANRWRWEREPFRLTVARSETERNARDLTASPRLQAGS
ncbi:TnsA endonuclease N-terminal domain-containing protein [Mycolicibacterium fortuitum]